MNLAIKTAEDMFGGSHPIHSGDLVEVMNERTFHLKIPSN